MKRQRNRVSLAPSGLIKPAINSFEGVHY